MRKIVLTFGLIVGAIMSAVLLITLPFHDKGGFEWGALLGYTSMVMAFRMVYFGVRSYRDDVTGGQISFRRALGVGLLITAVASSCYVATWEVIYFKFGSDFTAKYSVHQMDKARKSGASEADLAAKAKDMAEWSVMYNNPVMNSAITFLEPLPVGLVLTLVTAGILSRKRREEETLA